MYYPLDEGSISFFEYELIRERNFPVFDLNQTRRKSYLKNSFASLIVIAYCNCTLSWSTGVFEDMTKSQESQNFTSSEFRIFLNIHSAMLLIFKC